MGEVFEMHVGEHIPCKPPVPHPQLRWARGFLLVVGSVSIFDMGQEPQGWRTHDHLSLIRSSMISDDPPSSTHLARIG